MDTLLPLAEKAAALLRAKKQRIAIAESSTGGLI
jgi:nicotinamide mononucleotide (NMN) deamidase PncC